MFYSNELLCLKGGRFGLIWYLAINNPFKDSSALTKRGGRGRYGNSAVTLSEILSVDLKPVLHDLLRRLPIDSPEAFSLRLSANLLIGTVRCHVIRVAMLLRDVRNCRRSKPKRICDHGNIDKKQVLAEIGTDICQLGGNDNTQFGNVAYSEDDFAQMLDNAIEERMKHGHLFTMPEDDQFVLAEDDGFGPPLAHVDGDIFDAEFQEPLQVEQPQQFQDDQPLPFEDVQPEQQFQDDQPLVLEDEQPQQLQDVPVPPETDFLTEEPQDLFPAVEPVNGTQQNVNASETPGAPKRKGSVPIRSEETLLPDQERPAEEQRRSKRRRTSDVPDSRRNLFEDQDDEEAIPLAAPEVAKRPGPKKKQRKGQLAIDAIIKITEAEMRSNLNDDRNDIERRGPAILATQENWMLDTGKRPFLNAKLKDRFWQVASEPAEEEEVEIERDENLLRGEASPASIMSESHTSRIGKRRANPSFQIEFPSNGSVVLEDEREAVIAEEAIGEQGVEHMNLDQDYLIEQPDFVQEAFEPPVPILEEPLSPRIEETEEAAADIIPPPAAAQAFSSPLSPYGGSFYPSADNLLDHIRSCQSNTFTAVLDDFESQPTTKREAALAFRRLLDLEARQLVKCQQKEFYGTIRIRVL